jgi:hypothetical protein
MACDDYREAIVIVRLLQQNGENIRRDDPKHLRQVGQVEKRFAFFDIS